MDYDYEGFGYDGKEPVPCSDLAKKHALAVISMVHTDARLEQAIRAVPNYTGQWQPKDYYANAQEEWYRAADELAATTIALQAESNQSEERS
jgi:hypothetical protein